MKVYFYVTLAQFRTKIQPKSSNTHTAIQLDASFLHGRAVCVLLQRAVRNGSCLIKDRAVEKWCAQEPNFRYEKQNGSEQWTERMKSPALPISYVHGMIWYLLFGDMVTVSVTSCVGTKVVSAITLSFATSPSMR